MTSSRLRWAALGMTLLAVLLTACGGSTTSPTSPPAAPTTASAPRPMAPTSPPAPATVSPSPYQTVGGRDLGLTFEAPATWLKQPDEYVFRPPDGRPVVIGVSRHSLPPDGVEALLPPYSQIVDQVEIDLGWARGTEYTLDHRPPASQGVAPTRQVRFIVSAGSKATYDFFSVAPANDQAAITIADAARRHMVQSVTVIGG